MNPSLRGSIPVFRYSDIVLEACQLQVLHVSEKNYAERFSPYIWAFSNFFVVGVIAKHSVGVLNLSSKIQ